MSNHYTHAKTRQAIFTKKHGPHISTAQTSTSTIGRRSDYNCEIEEVTNNNCANTAPTATHLVLVNYSYRDKEMSCYLSLVFLLPLLLMEVDGESTCTEGFMDLDLIKNNMNHPARSPSVSTLAEGMATRWIITESDNKFNCSATLEEILIGVDIRTVNDTIGRDLYPRFEVWSPNGHDYTQEISVEIILTPDNFTTNGLYRYRLPQLVSVSDGYRMGVFQPPSEKSVVRFYKITGSGSGFKRVGKILLNSINKTVIRVMGKMKDIHDKQEQLNILLHPVTSPTGIIIQ